MKTKNYSLRCNSKTSLRKLERSQRRLWGDVSNQSPGRCLRDLQISPLWDISETLYETSQRSIWDASMPAGKQLIMDCFDCISISTSNSLAYLIPIPMFSLVPTAQKVRRAWDLMGTSVRNRPRFLSFVWQKVVFYTEVKFSDHNIFGTVFQTLRATGLIKLTVIVCKTPMLKKYLNSYKRCFLVWQFIENQAFVSFSLFKLIQFV